MRRWIGWLLVCGLSWVGSAWACDACFYDGEFSIPAIKVAYDDDPRYADPDYDDAHWPFFTLAESTKGHQGVYWLRGEFNVDPKARIPGMAYDFNLTMLASYELYMDGKLVGVSGTVGQSRQEEVPGPYRNSFPLPRTVVEKDRVTVALRLSSHYRIAPQQAYFDPLKRLADNRIVQGIDVEKATIAQRNLDWDDLFHYLFMTIPLVIGSYFLLIYAGDRQARHVLVFSLLCFSLFVLGWVDIFRWGVGNEYQWYVVKWWVSVVATVAIVLLFPLFFIFKFGLSGGRWWLIGLVLLLLPVLVLAEAHLVGRYVIFSAMALALMLHGVAWVEGRTIQLWPTALGLIVCMAGILSVSGVFFAAVTLFILLILAQLAMEGKLQRRRYLDSLVNNSRLEAQLLRKNIQPHFLMNALTSLMEWVEVEPEKGAEFVEALGEEFRLLIGIADQVEIPLAQELALCRRHMQIMGFRLQKDFHLTVNGEVDELQVPPAVMHTLVENGISHNHYEQPRVAFELQAETLPDRQVFRLATPLGNGRPGERRGTGTGLKYVRAQLQRAYPERWRFESGELDHRWVSTITILRR